MPRACAPLLTLFTVVACSRAMQGQMAQMSAQPFRSPQELVLAMLVRENDAHKDMYKYIANERSERTGGHLWTERIVEIPAGRVRLLLAEDGKPLSADRIAAERGKLAAIAANPAAFERAEASQRTDEIHDREMLGLLPRAFLLNNVRLDGACWKIDFHPNPDYSPSGIEEKVLHGMSGTVVINAADLRLVHIDAALPQDFSVGFGLLATIKAGSHFQSDREKIEDHWRTVHVVTDIRGKAALFKTVAKNSDIQRSDFHYLAGSVSPAEAVELVEQP